MDFISELWPFGLGAATVLLATYAISCLLRDDLGHVPGPWYVKFTGLVLTLNGWRARNLQYVINLHEKYGSVVRISPNEVSFSDVNSFRKIHKIGGGFIKSPFYDKQDATFGEHPNVFNMRDPKKHAARRKLYSRVMTLAYLRQNWESVMRERAHYCARRIRNDFAEQSKPGGCRCVDAVKWFRLLAGDVTAHLAFGQSFQNLELGEKVDYVKAIDNISLFALLQDALPVALFRFIAALPLPGMLGVLFKSADILLSQGKLAINNSKSNAETKNVFAQAIDESEKGSSVISELEISVDATTFIAAGLETTANTLQCLTWAVLKRPELQRLLEEELSQVTETRDDLLEKLPILNAVLDETLRLYGPASGTLPRLVPAGGVDIAGTYIPHGTVVGVPAYLLHHDPEAFPNPDQFDHTRFLPDSPGYAIAKKSLYPFGAGIRICIGMHVATMEIRLATAEFFRECRGARLAPSMQDMEIENVSLTFVTPPKHDRLEIVL